MHNFGLKVADDDPQRIGPVLDYAIRECRPLEVGLYFGEPAAHELLSQRLADSAVPVNAHTDHERFHAFNLDQTEDLLKAHIRVAQGLGSRYSILHAAGQPMTPRMSRRAALLSRLLDNLERAEELCEMHDYCLYLENVFHPLDLYRALFESIHSRGLNHIHFCFDIGHAKIWSKEALEDWLDFMDDLMDMGFGLHCHLHANQGFIDQHLAMAEVEALGIAGDDGFYNPYGYPGAYWVIERRFPEAVKVFEVKPELAIANYETVTAVCPFPELVSA